jgi:PKD repeat protein
MDKIVYWVINKLLMRFVYIFTLILTVLSFTSFAQEEETWHCSTEQIYFDIINSNPEVLKEREKLRTFVDDYIQNVPKTGETYIIPMVFHVVHYYGAENISYNQIVEAVDFINNDFNRLRVDTSSIINEFKSIAADCNIEFRLARKDPWGNCTVGVTRIVSETTYGGGEDAKEAAPTWPPDMYLNIWVVNALGNGAAGWSYYPGSAPYGSDGVILLYDYVGSSGTSNYGKGSTITHEIGHYLNLAHPWGHTNDPEVSTNCDMDDGIADTPNTIGHTSCTLSAVTCGSLDNVQNFMEYSYCTRMFTVGQAEEMRAVLNSSVSDRNNLITAQNLLATGTNDDYEPEMCPPVADFSANKKIGCRGFSVEYNDFTYGTDYLDLRTWSFEGGTPSVSEEEFPIVSYEEKGKFDVQLTSGNPVDSDVKLEQDYIRVYDIDDAYTLPYIESFETTSFPKIDDNTGNDFYLESRGYENWEQTSYGESGKGLRIINKRNETGIRNRVYLPNLKIATPDVPIYVSFKTAYGKSGDLYGDRLKIYISNSCGETSRIIQIISGSDLISTNASSFNTYTPLASHWRTQNFVIDPSLITGENLRIVVEAEAGGGNTLYIDEFSVSYSNSIEEISKPNLVSVFPNPASDEVYIENHSIVGEYTISIFDNFGRQIFEIVTTDEVFNASSAFAGKNSGLYLIKIQSGNDTEIIKLNKTK